MWRRHGPSSESVPGDNIAVGIHGFLARVVRLRSISVDFCCSAVGKISRCSMGSLIMVGVPLPRDVGSHVGGKPLEVDGEVAFPYLRENMGSSRAHISSGIVRYR